MVKNSDHAAIYGLPVSCLGLRQAPRSTLRIKPLTLTHTWSVIHDPCYAIMVKEHVSDPTVLPCARTHSRSLYENCICQLILGEVSWKDKLNLTDGLCLIWDFKNSQSDTRQGVQTLRSEGVESTIKNVLALPIGAGKGRCHSPCTPIISFISLS